MSSPEKPCLTGRLAPSPSGRMHAGNLFSFMIAAVALKQEARRQDRTPRLLLRIEDLDPDRSKKRWADQLQCDLELFDFEWDAEVLKQSERTEAYLQAFSRLAEIGLTYPCYCTRADLHVAHAPHAGEDFIYPGTCRSLSALDLEARHSYRLRVPDAAQSQSVIAFDDLFQGNCSSNLALNSGDFVIKRADGVFAYQLAVAVDDAWQGVDQVVRGYDLLSSTPRQLYIQSLLGLHHPDYGHVPLLVDEEGRRLAKRNRSTSLEHLLEERKLPPEAVLGKLAFQAGIIDDDVAMSLSELCDQADLTRLEAKRTLCVTGLEP